MSVNQPPTDETPYADWLRRSVAARRWPRIAHLANHPLATLLEARRWLIQSESMEHRWLQKFDSAGALLWQAPPDILRELSLTPTGFRDLACIHVAVLSAQWEANAIVRRHEWLIMAALFGASVAGAFGLVHEMRLDKPFAFANVAGVLVFLFFGLYFCVLLMRAAFSPFPTAMRALRRINSRLATRTRVASASVRYSLEAMGNVALGCFLLVIAAPFVLLSGSLLVATIEVMYASLPVAILLATAVVGLCAIAVYVAARDDSADEERSLETAIFEGERLYNQLVAGLWITGSRG